jgi:tRNA 2-selenouridine synthase
MNQEIEIQDFLQKAVSMPVFDVRAPQEFQHAHIPGALSLPIFNDDQRAAIGTKYKQVSREQAILLGFEYFGPRMRLLIEQALTYTNNLPQEVLVHCWRGGMRSEAMSWMLEFYGFSTYRLIGGYKAFRNYILDLFESKRNWIILGGYTGSGKTMLLEQISQMGNHVLDLEKAASHRGSSFGSIHCPPQPTQEYFENLIGMNYPLPTQQSWIEDESRKIGINIIPLSLYEQMQQAPHIFIDIPVKKRLEYLTDQYLDTDIQLLTMAVQRLEKRLGGLAVQQALHFLSKKDIYSCFAIVLQYYDSTYQYALSRKEQSLIHHLHLPDVFPVRKNAEIILDFASQKNLLL